MEKIIERSANAGAAERVRIFADNGRFSPIKPDQMMDALQSLIHEGSLQVLSRNDHDQTYTSFDLLLKKPMLDRARKVQIPVALTDPEKLSNTNLAALMKLVNQIMDRLELTQDSDIDFKIQPEAQAAFDYLKQSGTAYLLDAERISVYRHVFNDLYDRLRVASDERDRKPSEIEGSQDSGEFVFNQGVLFRHGNTVVEKFDENTFEHELLLIAFKFPFGEQIDTMIDDFVDREWRTIYDAARRINDKVMARFGISDFFKIDYKNKFIERNAK
ncbi:hypothetical protein FJZ48_00945 [Candidatus Uhrbacteria bacterium]|nr:hypothetical protein [Candidatus Uhrbacteria bacterium]